MWNQSEALYVQTNTLPHFPRNLIGVKITTGLSADARHLESS